jgi:hypothetical protein
VVIVFSGVGRAAGAEPGLPVSPNGPSSPSTSVRWGSAWQQLDGDSLLSDCIGSSCHNSTKGKLCQAKLVTYVKETNTVCVGVRGWP